MSVPPVKQQHAKPGTCVECREPVPTGQRQCRLHHAEYMRRWRAAQKGRAAAEHAALLAELAAVREQDAQRPKQIRVGRKYKPRVSRGKALGRVL